MRENISILWVEDSKAYYEEAKQILEMYASDKGVKINFRYIEDVKILLDELTKQEQGFQVYDICFVDYALSTTDGNTGENIIKELRQKKVGTDILFYSSEYISTIREILLKDISSFEGVYVADRDSFEEKSNLLLNKNSKKLYSINNIRGILMNETSENDYIMKSYIIRKFSTLGEEQQKEITNIVKNKIKDKIEKLTQECNDLIAKIENDKILPSNKILKISNDLFSLNDRYSIFEKILELNSSSIEGDCTLDKYFKEIISLRNKLAHRKLEICETCKYVMHYNDIEDFEQKHCQIDDCTEICKHEKNNKVNIKDWQELKKQLVQFGHEMDKLFEII